MKTKNLWCISLTIIVLGFHNNVHSQPGSFTDYVEVAKDTSSYNWYGFDDVNNRYWAIMYNWLGAEEFGIYDNGSLPFILESGAPEGSVYINSNGRLGLGTTTPGGIVDVNLTIAEGGSGYSGVSLPTSETEWVVAARAGGFGIGNTSIFEEALTISTADGFVGLGTGDPLVALEISGNDPSVTTANTTQIKVQNASGDQGTRVLFNLINNGGVRFDMLDQATGSNWVFQNQFGSFDVTLAGTGTREFRFYPNGNLEISGAYLQSSSRSIKHGVEAVDQQSVLEKVVALPISVWTYNHEEGVRHMGPMSEDFYASFGLGGTDKGITTVDAGGVALAAIQGLKQEKDDEIAKLTSDKDREIADLHAQLQLQEDRMIQLEMTLAEVLRKQSSGVQVGSTD